MTVPTVSFDPTSPAGSQAISLGDDRIRELKVQFQEILNVDHDVPASGQGTDWGQHKQVTLQEQADLGTGAAGATILGSQTVSGKGELVYTDEDDNDIQITSAGKINAAALGGVYPAANGAALATMMNFIYPVGHIYISYVSTDPGTLLGVGTWAVFGAGKFLISLDSGDTDFDTVGETGGAKTVTLDTTMIPAHTHSMVIDSNNSNSAAGNESGAVQPQSINNSFTNGTATGSAGGGGAHNNMPPFIAVYMWRRTA